ncbi:MAG: hypothetical protein LBS02_03555 [Hungatella sp.]|jgi:hypothetical protein|nr:hypothetical protein [Hungatella sp.]
MTFGKDESNEVKGVAILLLLFHHLFLHREYMEQVGLNYSVDVYYKIFPIVNMSRICVWIFTFISAYGLSIKYKSYRERSEVFVIKQWLKLMWKWWIVWLFMIIVYAVFKGNLLDHYHRSLKELFLDFFEWNDFFGKPRVLGSWYLCFAQLVIICIPAINAICEKLGYLSLPLSYITIQFMGEGIVSTGGGRYSQYFLTVIAGVCLAQNSFGLLEHRDHKIVRVMEAVGYPVSAFGLLILQYKLIVDLRQISSVLRMLAVVCLVITIVKYIVGPLKRILIFFGENSTVMFMTNVFFYVTFPELIFGSKSPILSYISLVIVTFVCARLINIIGEKSGYYKFLDKILDCCDSKIMAKGD